jgi:nitrilase
MEKVKVAAVQAAPAFLDTEATVGLVEKLAGEAAAAGAGLIVFPETFVPTYPDWIWRAKPWQDSGEYYGRLLEESVVVPGPVTEQLGRLAHRLGVYLAIGVNERDPLGSTIYNTLLYFDDAGRLAGKHRKLVPTGPERLVWGYGDGSTLTVIDTPFGRLGGLICWENYMPLARAAMYAQGVDIWVAPTWDSGDGWVATLRHIAREGRVHVIGCATCQHSRDVPPGMPQRDQLYTDADDDWMCEGYSAIVKADGDLLAGPLIKETGILYAELDAASARSGRRAMDPVGHYSRPDVFHLSVNTAATSIVDFGPPLPAAAKDGNGAVAATRSGRSAQRRARAKGASAS